MTQYNFRRSDFTTFWSDPAKFVQKFLNPEKFTPNEAMQFGTDQHTIREKENGGFAEVYIEVPMGDHLIHGTLDYYDGKEIVDYKYSQNISKYKSYIPQIGFYQWLVYEKYGLLVPARLEFVEVNHNPFAQIEFTLTGVVKNYNFTKPNKTDLIQYEKKVLSSLKQMVYLVEKAKQPKPKIPKLKYTKEELIEMSAYLPDEMRTKNSIRYSSKSNKNIQPNV